MKKLMSFILALVLVFSAGSYAFAETDERNNIDAFFSTGEIPETLNGIDQFFTILTDGTISFDIDSALSAGYAEEDVVFVSNNIKKMNYLLTEMDGYLTPDFSLVIPISGTRAVGESKIVTTWYGLTQVYMNSDEAQDLIDELNAVGDIIAISGFLALLPSPYSTLVGFYLYGTSMGILIYRNQVISAASAGTGIIMNIMDIDGENQTVWFTAQ